MDILSVTILECLNTTLSKFIQSYNCTFAHGVQKPTCPDPSLAPRDYPGPRSGKARISFYY